jgi:ADP-ribose pyrophosphatase YjhB (NUDIX family)
MEKTTVIKARWLILSENKIFLCKLAKQGFYCLPGWTLEPWELVKQTLEREFVEELWTRPIIWKLAYINEFINRDGWTTLDMWYFIENVGDFKEKIDLSKASHWFELSEVWFYDLEKLENYRPDNLRQIIKLIKNGEIELS